MSSPKTLQQALLAAQAQIEQPVKNASNPHFKNKFADLGACFDAVRDALQNSGITITQPLMIQRNHITGGSDQILVTRLAFETPASDTHVAHLETLESHAIIPQGAPQQMGSAITYMRRYSLCALLGLVAEDDDDGNAASAPVPNGNGGKRATAADLFISIAEKAKSMEEVEKAWQTLPVANRVGAAKVAYGEAKERLA